MTRQREELRQQQEQLRLQKEANRREEKRIRLLEEEAEEASLRRELKNQPGLRAQIESDRKARNSGSPSPAPVTAPVTASIDDDLLALYTTGRASNVANGDVISTTTVPLTSSPGSPHKESPRKPIGETEREPNGDSPAAASPVSGRALVFHDRRSPPSSRTLTLPLAIGPQHSPFDP